MNEIDKIFAQYSSKVDPNIGARTPIFRAQQPQKPKGNQLLKTILSIVGGTAGAIGGTFVNPGAGTAAGGALGSGLGTFLGRAIGGESLASGESAKEVALDAALGGAFSGAGKAAKAAKAGQAALQVGGKELGRQTVKGLTESAGVATGKEAVQKAGQTGLTGVLERLGRGGTVARTSTIGTASGQEALVDLSRRYSKELGATGAAKFRNIEPLIGKLTNQADDVLKGVKKTLPANRFNESILAGARELADSPTDLRQFNSIVGKHLKPYAGKPELTALDLNNIRRGINKEFTGIFKKQKVGGQLTRGEIVADDIRKTIGQQIDDLGGKAIKPINRDISIAMDSIPEFKKLGEQVSRVQLPFTNTPIPGLETLRQAGSDLIGRTATRGAGTAGVAPLTLSNILTRQAIGQGITGGFTETPQQPTQPGMEDMTGMGDMEDITGMAGDMGVEQAGADEQTQIDQYFQGLALQDLQQTGGKRLSSIKAAYDLFGGGKAEKKSISQQNAERKLRQARGVVDTLEQELRAAGGPGGFGRVVERGLANIPELGGTISPRVAAFENARQGSLALISKALGESGVLTDQDIKRALNFVPTITDSPEQAARKFRILRSYLDLGNQSTVGTDTRFNF